LSVQSQPTKGWLRRLAATTTAMAMAAEADSSLVRSEKSRTQRRPFTRSAELLPDWQRRPQDVAGIPGELVDKVLIHLSRSTEAAVVSAESVATALESLGLRQGDGFPTLEAVVRAVCRKAASSGQRPALAAAPAAVTNEKPSCRPEKDTLSEESPARAGVTISARPEPTLPVCGTASRRASASTSNDADQTEGYRQGDVVALAASDPGEDAWGRSTARVREALGLPAPAALAGLMPDWEDDESRSSCALCQRAFVGTHAADAALAGLGVSGARVVWRHHCRCCGVLVCCRCAPHTVELAALGKGAKPVRICNFCHFDITSSAEVARIALVP
jgi:hypothetical protein